MKPFMRVEGIAAPLLLNNIDTDQITPGHQIIKLKESGFDIALFHNWRFLADGGENPDFVLNQQPFRDARFLLTGSNFGCGSSREWSAWALRDFGIRAVIAPSFSPIFAGNCFMNGLAPIVLPEEEVAAIAASVSPGRADIVVDLEACRITGVDGAAYVFSMPSVQRERLLEGLDAIDFTLKREAMIADFQASDVLRRPWIYSV